MLSLQHVINIRIIHGIFYGVFQMCLKSTVHVTHTGQLIATSQVLSRARQHILRGRLVVMNLQTLPSPILPSHCLSPL